jgi:hypothetical protein
VVEVGVGCASGNSTKTVCSQDDRGSREVEKNNANGSRPETTNAAGDVAITGRTSSQVR